MRSDAISRPETGNEFIGYESKDKNKKIKFTFNSNQIDSSAGQRMAAHVEIVPILGEDRIRVGFHLQDYIIQTVLTTLPSSTYVLFTDSHLAPIYLDSFEKSFQLAINSLPEGNRPRWISHVILPGEQSKNRETKAALEDLLLEYRCTRDTVVLALGGGVVGDLIGFVCANFMRGIQYCQIPTTLLAMVDSAVGGKVGYWLLYSQDGTDERNLNRLLSILH